MPDIATGIGAGRMLIGLDSSDTDFDTVEETGGANTMTTSNTGSGTAHSIMNPYIAVYMWKRTA